MRFAEQSSVNRQLNSLKKTGKNIKFLNLLELSKTDGKATIYFDTRNIDRETFDENA